MQRLEGAYRNVMAWLTGLSLFVCFVVVLASSISRYAFDAPFQWSEELAKFAMIYGTVFGAALSYLSGMQVRFVVFISILPQRLVPRIEFISDVAVFLLGAALSVSGYLFMIRRGGIMASGLNIPMYYPQAAIMIGGACLAMAAALRLCRAFADRDDGGRRDRP